jgi:hypothetical protein
MKTVITTLFATLVVALIVGGAIWLSLNEPKRLFAPKIAEFNDEASTLIQGLQQYKEFVHAYPAGNNLDVARALAGQSDSRVVIIFATKLPKNSKGEILDPWGTPLQFYFSGNSVLIRSAGPNKVWEDSSVPNGDDLFRSN